jgi:hemerythrin-like metal-binding protein
MEKRNKRRKQPMAASLLRWGEEHRIGVAALDFEHQALFKRISELDQELAEAQDADRIEDLLGEIHARMSAHFALEEQFMREKKYAGYSEHKREHDRFLDEFGEAVARTTANAGIGARDVLREELRHWIVGHVLTSDKKMSAAAASR